jgi:flavin-dependent dehydrogenase
MTEHTPAYDVVVLGGGLAGLTFALQLEQARPGTRVLVLERRRHPVNEAAHKVGESSVEVGAHYFTRVLGQLEHFRAAQLPKLGLRYFFDGDDPADVTTRTELGGNTFFPTESFQIDRGRFENHLGTVARAAGAEFVDGAVVSEVLLGEGGAPHQVAFTVGDTPRRVEARWVIDASGRASLLKKKLGLAKKNDHDANAVWWRYDQRVTVDDWSDDRNWQEHTGGRRQRWLSTVHLMGAGYWVWLIPLASGSHSIGIVADAKLHPFGTMSTYAKAMAWLRKHEPQCADRLEGRDSQLQDFLALKDFSYDCKQLYSADRWALVGEAGAFLDPFYSPGSDYIAMANTWATDLVVRDLAGERRIAARAEVYNRIFATFYGNHLSLYQDQMPMFGDAKVMALKIIWDFAYYWSMPASFFFHERLTDVLLFAGHKAALDRVADLNRAIQQLFRDWHAAGIRVAPVFVNIPGIPFMLALNRGLRDPLDRDAFERRLTEDLAQLERLAGELAGEARRDVPGIALGPLGALATETVELLATVLPLLQARRPTPEPPAVEVHA